MSSKINQIFTESALKILRPLVRVMIRNGVSRGRFEELVRKAYVDEAFLVGEKNKQKTTVPSVSAQSGLSRKEVKGLNEQDVIHNADIEQRYNRVIPTKVMLNLLVADDCVRVKDDTVQLIKHAYIPGNDSAEIIRILGTDANELLKTIDFNLSSEKNDKRYQRKVSTAVLNKNAIKEFRILSQEKSQAVLEELDA
jgi:hypothetical protein